MKKDDSEKNNDYCQHSRNNYSGPGKRGTNKRVRKVVKTKLKKGVYRNDTTDY